MRKQFFYKLNYREADMKQNTETWMGIRGVIKLYEKMLKRVCTEHHLTVIEADVISFLQNNPEKDTAADIVELRMLSKGAVSKAVESLIQKSLLDRRPDQQDRRRIHLILKPEAGPVTESIESVQDEFWDMVLEGFTEEELEGYARFRKKRLNNSDRAMEIDGKTEYEA